jgi:hypothetical protein
MRKAVLATVTVGLILGGTGMAVADESVSNQPSASVGNCAAAASPTMLTSAQAADAALRGAGGGRVAGVQLAEEAGRALYSVQFVRGNRLQTATVDAFTGDVTSISNDNAGGGNAGGNGQDGTGDSTDNSDSGTDDSDDDSDDDGDDDADDDGGPIREGVEGNK